MKLNTVKAAAGATKKRKRVARGQGSGSAGTAGRGHKGAKSRSGYSRKLGFEGGQMPLQRRVPKFGFKNINRVEYKGINLDTLQKLADDKKVKDVTLETLVENGLASKNDLVKILGRGELKAKLTVTVHGYSASAKAAIEAAGGTAALNEVAQKMAEIKAAKGTKPARKAKPVAEAAPAAKEETKEAEATQEEE